jgi:hypothetical protein
MKSARYGPGMRRAPITMAGLVVVAAVSLAGCDGSTGSATTEGPAGSSTSASPEGSDSPADAPASAMVVVRTGGIAGFRDLVQVAADGTARVTTKTGTTRDCTPSASVLDRLRAIDLAAVAATKSTPPPMADGFNYSVRSAGGSAAAGEGDDDSRRAEFVDAAAAVVASCLANQSGSSYADQ